MSHLELLEGVRALQRAVLLDDVCAVRGELSRLSTAFTDHVNSEREAIAHLHPATQRVVARGQRRLLNLIDQLLNEAENGIRDCTCLVHSAELIRQLSRQARLEIDLFGQLAASASSRPGVIPPTLHADPGGASRHPAAAGAAE